MIKSLFSTVVKKLAFLNPVSTFIRYALDRTLNQFLDTQLTLEDFKDGVLDIARLQINATKINSQFLLSSPFFLHSGTIGSLSVILPHLSELTTKSIEIVCEELIFVLKPNRDFDLHLMRSFEEAQAQADFNNDTLDGEMRTGDGKDYFKQLIKQIATNIKVTVKGVTVRLYHDEQLREHFCLQIPLIYVSKSEIQEKGSENYGFKVKVPQILAGIVSCPINQPGPLLQPNNPSTICLIGLEQLNLSHSLCPTCIVTISTNYVQKVQKTTLLLIIPRVLGVFYEQQVVDICRIVAVVSELKARFKVAIRNTNSAEQSGFGNSNFQSSLSFVKSCYATDFLSSAIFNSKLVSGKTVDRTNAIIDNIIEQNDDLKRNIRQFNEICQQHKQEFPQVTEPSVIFDQFTKVLEWSFSLSQLSVCMATDNNGRTEVFWDQLTGPLINQNSIWINLKKLQASKIIDLQASIKEINISFYNKIKLFRLLEIISRPDVNCISFVDAKKEPATLKINGSLKITAHMNAVQAVLKISYSVLTALRKMDLQRPIEYSQQQLQLKSDQDICHNEAEEIYQDESQNKKKKSKVTLLIIKQMSVAIPLNETEALRMELYLTVINLQNSWLKVGLERACLKLVKAEDSSVLLGLMPGNVQAAMKIIKKDSLSACFGRIEVDIDTTLAIHLLETLNEFVSSDCFEQIVFISSRLKNMFKTKPANLNINVYAQFFKLQALQLTLRVFEICALIQHREMRVSLSGIRLLHDPKIVLIDHLGQQRNKELCLSAYEDENEVLIFEMHATRTAQAIKYGSKTYNSFFEDQLAHIRGFRLYRLVKSLSIDQVESSPNLTRRLSVQFPSKRRFNQISDQTIHQQGLKLSFVINIEAKIDLHGVEASRLQQEIPQWKIVALKAKQLQQSLFKAINRHRRKYSVENQSGILYRYSFELHNLFLHLHIFPRQSISGEKAVRSQHRSVAVIAVKSFQGESIPESELFKCNTVLSADLWFLIFGDRCTSLNPLRLKMPVESYAQLGFLKVLSLGSVQCQCNLIKRQKPKVSLEVRQFFVEMSLQTLIILQIHLNQFKKHHMDNVFGKPYPPFSTASKASSILDDSSEAEDLDQKVEFYRRLALKKTEDQTFLSEVVYKNVTDELFDTKFLVENICFTMRTTSDFQFIDIVNLHDSAPIRMKRERKPRSLDLVTLKVQIASILYHQINTLHQMELRSFQMVLYRDKSVGSFLEKLLRNVSLEQIVILKTNQFRLISRLQSEVTAAKFFVQYMDVAFHSELIELGRIFVAKTNSYRQNGTALEYPSIPKKVDPYQRIILIIPSIKMVVSATYGAVRILRQERLLLRELVIHEKLCREEQIIQSFKQWLKDAFLSNIVTLLSGSMSQMASNVIVDTVSLLANILRGVIS